MIYLIGIGLLIILVFLVVFYIKNKIAYKECLNTFKSCNTIVFGKKGTGKDLVFQKIINDRKEPYYSNISYGGEYNEINVKDITTGNTYEDFIDNQIKLANKDPKKENKDIYLSDCGIILPSQYDTLLHKKYPSFSSYYALSRHLYNSNIHCNTQALSRVWKSLREQADFYILCKRSFKIFGFMFTRVITYDRYQTAELQLTPFKAPKGLNSKQAKELYNEFYSLHGDVKSFMIWQRIKSIKYDTRAYHEKIFGLTFKQWQKEQKKQQGGPK